MIHNKISVTTADLNRSQLLKCREKIRGKNCILSQGLISYITASLVFVFLVYLHGNIVPFNKIIFENKITFK